MALIISIEIWAGNKKIGFDDTAEYDQRTKTLNPTTVRWLIDNPGTYLNTKVTIKGLYKDEGGKFINDMTFTQSAANHTNCAFKGT